MYYNMNNNNKKGNYTVYKYLTTFSSKLHVGFFYISVHVSRIRIEFRNKIVF